MYNKKLCLKLFLLLSLGLATLASACTINNQLEIENFNSAYIFIHGKNNIKINAKIADTDKLRQIGLMGVKSLPKDNGMLFIFDEESKHCFWMKNTYLPLTIAFIDKNKKILEIQDMQTNTEIPYCPKMNITYTLEMNKGWFEQNNIKINDVLDF